MSRNISAAVYEKHGNPADVLHVERRPWPTPAADEAVVKMYAAPINPADLNQIEGKYPVRPELPATPGFEGAGVIVELGAGVKGLTSDALVILPHNVGTWRDAVAVKAEELVVVPEGIEPVQAAMLKINPLTAWRLLHDYVDLQKSDWLIQNAANSATGRDVIKIAHELGFKTVNVVRRADLVDELRAEGGDIVLVDGD
ncbi:MAG: 2-enoyl thioester reductase domain-containing protein, partial [Candidatus Udaeobacter sp.]